MLTEIQQQPAALDTFAGGFFALLEQRKR